MRILTAAQLREVDRLSSEQFGIPGIVLMENAGMRVLEGIDARVDDLESLTFVILCGKGNNGGDGMVVARQLIGRGAFPSVYLFADPAEVSGDARTNLNILTAIGYPPVRIRNADEWFAELVEISHADIVIDALLGTGLSKPVEGLLGTVLASLSDDFPRAMIVSVDVPSGCAADSSDVGGPTVEADLTVTLSAPKFCLVFPPAHEMAGEVVIADIGNPHELIEADGHDVDLLLADSFPDALVPRADDTNKGHYGKILVIGGARGKAGAVAMASEAALRAGAGLVTAAVPETVFPVVASHMAEIMTEPFPDTDEGSLGQAALDYGRLDATIAGKTVVALGPGIGRHVETENLVRDLVSRLTVPVVLDADGLNAFAEHRDELRGREVPIVVTPHPGEMSRLTGRATRDIVRNRLGAARDYATDRGLWVVLKGFRTVVACPDGRTFVNSTGNAAMATAGSGDILTGLIAGLLGQPHLGDFEDRLCLAVYLHGLAGDLAAEELGEEFLVATDILGFLPEAWSELRGE